MRLGFHHTIVECHRYQTNPSFRTCPDTLRNTHIKIILWPGSCGGMEGKHSETRPHSGWQNVQSLSNVQLASYIICFRHIWLLMYQNDRPAQSWVYGQDFLIRSFKSWVFWNVLQMNRSFFMIRLHSIHLITQERFISVKSASGVSLCTQFRGAV